MNLMGLVTGAIQAVNPNIDATWIQATGGYTTDAAGHRTPTTTSVSVSVQVQGTSSADLKLIDNIEIEKDLRKVYMYGDVQGVNRPDQRGGDLLEFAQIPGSVVRQWKVVGVLEVWPTWACVIVALQE